jgi:uncharacterized membrane protein YtjA (UPF0391 family)
MRDRTAARGEPRLHAVGALMRRTPRQASSSGRRIQMLGWALVFLVVALIAGLLGFTGLAVASAGIAQILFYIFVVLFVISSLIYLIRGRAPPTV